MILVAGCGSLGCELARWLKQRPINLFKRILFVDFDSFEHHNIANQLLAKEGWAKARVLADYLQDICATDCLIRPVYEVLNPEHFDLVFSTTDSLAAREFCVRNFARVVDVGVSGDAFSVRCYSAGNSAFVDLFTSEVPYKCSISRIRTSEDLVREAAGGTTGAVEIQRVCRRENALYGFDCDFSIDFIRKTLKIPVQSACLCQIAARKAVDLAVRLLSGYAAPDVLMGSFHCGFSAQIRDLAVDVTTAQRVVVNRGKIVFWEEMGVFGPYCEIDTGSIFFV